MPARESGAEQLQQLLTALLLGYKTTAERVAAIRMVLEARGGAAIRRKLGRWIVRLVPVETLVPDLHRQWRPVVREAMLFVVSRLSAARLAPKIIEQIELPPETPAETRLLALIARVPGLQKIGQVLARNRDLHPELRRALSELENGISDVGIEEIRAIIFRQLGPEIAKYAVRVDSAIYSEASVSAVVRFTWRNPQSRRRERGVFKVLKPHIPGCYAEDMKILQQLAAFLAHKHRGEKISFAGVAETLTEIRLLLEREVDFRREQATLREAFRVYQPLPAVRVPRLIQSLCTDTITALTEEKGVKVTDAFTRPGARRVRVAEQLAQALVAVPSLAPDKQGIFHADPHAGNLLYDRSRGELVILDWALTEHFSREQRRRLLMLVLMITLRDKDGICSAIEHLRLRGSEDRAQARLVRRHVGRMLSSLPPLYVPGTMDAMRLLHDMALEGVRFPAALLIFRKASFTLEGVLEDVAGRPVPLDAAVGKYALSHWAETLATLWLLLSPGDWLTLQWSALTFVSRVFVQTLLPPWRWLPALLETAPARR